MLKIPWNNIFLLEIVHGLFHPSKYGPWTYFTITVTLFCLDQFHTQWFLPGTLVSSTNETDRLNITEILLKVALNTITLPPISFQELFYCYIFIMYQLSCSIGQIILTEWVNKPSYQLLLPQNTSCSFFLIMGKSFHTSWSLVHALVRWSIYI